MKTMVLGHECRSSCCRVKREKSQGPCPQPGPQDSTYTTHRVQRWPSTYDLAFSTPKVQEKETGTIIRGHLQLLKGLSKQHSSSRTWLSCPQCEALVNVHRETAGTAVPRAGCGEGCGHQQAAARTTSPATSPYHCLHSGLEHPTKGVSPSIMIPGHPPCTVTPTLENTERQVLREPVSTSSPTSSCTITRKRV